MISFLLTIIMFISSNLSTENSESSLFQRNQRRAVRLARVLFGWHWAGLFCWPRLESICFVYLKFAGYPKHSLKYLRDLYDQSISWRKNPSNKTKGALWTGITGKTIKIQRSTVSPFNSASPVRLPVGCSKELSKTTQRTCNSHVDAESTLHWWDASLYYV